MNNNKIERQSSLELLRIFSMLCIIAYHYYAWIGTCFEAPPMQHMK